MKIVLFGRDSQLGKELLPALAPLGEVLAAGRQEFDLRDAAALETFIRSHKPQIIVNASAYTAVDRAEQEQELAFQVNCHAPGLMAELACELDAAFIHFSTDYVFDGALGRPYVETDAPNPLNVYGRSKLAGEQAVQKAGGAYLIFRAAWVYSMGGDSFVTKVLGWARQNETLRIVDDQISNPTWARTLAKVTSKILARGKSYLSEHRGLYHLAASGYASRYEWARKILELDPHREEQVCQEILPALTGDFPAPARRPLFSALDCGKHFETFGCQLPDWKDALAFAIRDNMGG